MAELEHLVRHLKHKLAQNNVSTEGTVSDLQLRLLKLLNEGEGRLKADEYGCPVEDDQAPYSKSNEEQPQPQITGYENLLLLKQQMQQQAKQRAENKIPQQTKQSQQQIHNTEEIIETFEEQEKQFESPMNELLAYLSK